MRSKRTTGSYRYQRQRWPAAGTREHHIFGKFVLWVLVAAVGIGGLYVGQKILAQIDFFQVAAIEIQGCKRLSKAEVLELSGVDIHSNLMAIDADNLQSRLEQDDWIELADVSRKWPDRLIISIRERQPVAMVNLEGELQYIDKNGIVFASAKGADSLDYPVISGLSKGGWPGELAVSLEEALLFVKYVARNNNPNLPPQNISELMVSAESIVLFLMEKTRFRKT